MSENELLRQTHKNAERHFKNDEYTQAAACYSKLVPNINEKDIWHIEMLGSYAICLKHMKEYELSEKILFKQIGLYKEFGSSEISEDIFLSNLSLCEIYQKQEKYCKAISVLELYAENCDFGMHITNYYLAINQDKVGQPLLAKKHAKLAIKAANNQDQKTHIRNELNHLL